MLVCNLTYLYTGRPNVESQLRSSLVCGSLILQNSDILLALDAPSDLRGARRQSTLRGYTLHMAAVVSLNDEFVRVVVDVNILLIHSNIGVAEELGHFLKRNALGLGEPPPDDEKAESGNNDEHEVEFPADSGKCL
jgi:hypothetical protein